jgi:hypothetical protein
VTEHQRQRYRQTGECIVGIKQLSAIFAKVLGNLRLLRQDPERFARNVSQYTHPKLFEQRLVDILNPVPMYVAYDKASLAPPTLNVLDASWSALGMTGGPNTVINLVCRVARLGVPVRLVSTVSTVSIDVDWFRKHVRELLATPSAPHVELVSAAQSGHPLAIGPRDVFLATHWTTAQQLKPILQYLPIKQFFYMLQEFEPGFYAWSSNFALAAETYGLDFWPIVNGATLADYLFELPLGKLNDPNVRSRAIIFEPAVDAALFRAEPPGATCRPRRLLYYARPTNPRNMFGLGLTALRQAATDPAFAGWEFLAIGSRGSAPRLQLGGGHMISPAPWSGYSDYASLLREADILLCPMFSPHTSYPVLEMAASGGLAITNTFATKTAEALNALSNNILPVEPTVEGFVEGLRRGARIVNSCSPRTSSSTIPRSWDSVLEPVARRIVTTFHELAGGAVLDTEH